MLVATLIARVLNHKLVWLGSGICSACHAVPFHEIVSRIGMKTQSVVNGELWPLLATKGERSTRRPQLGKPTRRTFALHDFDRQRDLSFS